MSVSTEAELRFRPDWVYFSCLFVRDEAVGLPAWTLGLAFPPDLVDPIPEAGDLVTLTGRIGFNESRFRACEVTATDPQYEEGAALARLTWPLTCQTRFVVSGVEVH